MGSGSFALAKDPLFFMPAGNGRCRSEPLVLHEENNPLGTGRDKRGGLGKVRHQPTTKGGAETGRHPLHHFSSIDVHSN